MEVDSPEEKKLFVFAARGHKHDVRLRVFDTEYQVHSVILKLYSAYFFKFLDSPEKQNQQISSTARFKYEWVTRVDEDGTWSLESVGNDNQTLRTVLTNPKVNVTQEKKSFQKFMCSLYSKDYRIDDTDEIIKLTELADYYCALPKFSASVMADVSHAWLSKEIWGQRFRLLPILQKLRRSELFRDCVIIIAGCWDKEDRGLARSLLKDDLFRAVECARSKINSKIVAAHQEVLGIGEEYVEFRAAVEAIKYTESMTLPAYYRGIAKLAKCHRGVVRKLPALKELLSTDFVFIGEDDEAGSDSVVAYFLSGIITENDLPWDADQADW